jgi:TonB family protein
MRTSLLLFVAAGIASAQAVDVAGVVAQVRAMRNSRDGAGPLEKAVHSCEAAAAPNDDCADAYDWYGMVLQIDATPETLSRAEPLYRRALELRGTAAQGARALSLELDSLALKALDAAQAELLWDQAQKIRAENVKAIGALPLEPLPNSPLLPLPPPMDKPGNFVSPPAVAFRVDPSYSDEARLIRYSGSVLLSIVVDTSGRATSIQVVKGLGFGLDEKAAEAVRKWVFRPGMKAGSPVNVQARIEVNFRLL